MIYKYFQRQNPEWPKRLRDVVGRKVRLLCDIETRGKVKFKKGEILEVLSAHRGRLHLAREITGLTLNGWIRQVDPRDVEIVREADIEEIGGRR